MPLTKIAFAPGIDKQDTEYGAAGRWVDSDFVRFRYGLPEKIGGWEQITSSTLVGAARDQHIWADLDGRSYAAIGTHKALFIYYFQKVIHEICHDLNHFQRTQRSEQLIHLLLH